MSTLAMCALLLAAPAEAPRDLVGRAVVAHGGREKLSAVHADRVTLRGHVFSAAAALPFVSRMAVQRPGQFKSVMEVAGGGRTRVVAHVLDGERASVTIDGKAQPASPAHLAQLRRTLALDTAMRLVPLLDDPRYTLSTAGDFDLDGRLVTGVTVSWGGHAGLKLYFDKKAAVLMAAEHEVDGVIQQTRYAGHRDMGGYLRPGRVTVYRAGKKVMEAEVAEARREERIDPAEFHIP